MSRSDPMRVDDYLGHVVEANDNIFEYTADMDSVAFLLDRKTQDAVIRNFEIMGEASNNVTQHHATFAAAHPGVPWNLRMRCATRSRMATTRWTNKSYGEPSVMTCPPCGRPNRPNRLCGRLVYEQAGLDTASSSGLVYAGWRNWLRRSLLMSLDCSNRYMVRTEPR